jgi:hypothetical protein
MNPAKLARLRMQGKIKDPVVPRVVYCSECGKKMETVMGCNPRTNPWANEQIATYRCLGGKCGMKGIPQGLNQLGEVVNDPNYEPSGPLYHVVRPVLKGKFMPLRAGQDIKTVSWSKWSVDGGKTFYHS